MTLQTQIIRILKVSYLCYICYNIYTVKQRREDSGSLDRSLVYLFVCLLVLV